MEKTRLFRRVLLWGYIVFVENAGDGFLTESFFHQLAEFGVFEGWVGYILVSGEYFRIKVCFHTIDLTLNFLLEKPLDVFIGGKFAKEARLPMIRRRGFESFHERGEQFSHDFISAFLDLVLHR